MSSSGLNASPASSTSVRPRVAEAVLRQVADRQPGGLEDRAGVGLVEPGQHLEQRGLAGAVRAAQADALAVVDLPADGVEQDAVAERFGESRRAGSTRYRALFAEGSWRRPREARAERGNGLVR